MNTSKRNVRLINIFVDALSAACDRPPFNLTIAYRESIKIVDILDQAVRGIFSCSENFHGPELNNCLLALFRITGEKLFSRYSYVNISELK